MDPITWATLITKVGLPVAEVILKAIHDNKPVAYTEWMAEKAEAMKGYDEIPAAVIA